MTQFYIFAANNNFKFMKRTFLLLFLLAVASASFAQKTPANKPSKKEPITEQKKYSCDSIVVDFETGLLNGIVSPSFPIDSIKKYLPCITLEIPLGSEDRICGGGAVLEKQGIFFNLEHGFIEFSASTSAHLTGKVMGVIEEELSAVTGDPTQITDLQPYSDRPIQSVYLYPKSFGCVAIWVDQKDKKVYRVQLHNTEPSKVFLCLE